MADAQNMANKKILIVDDDKFLIDMYSRKFTESGFKIDVASSGTEALEKLENKTFEPDICLIDIIMPAMDGFALIDKIKEKNVCPDSTLIILSNLGQQEDIEKGLAKGAAGYIVKASATPSEVVQKVTDIFNNKGK